MGKNSRSKQDQEQSLKPQMGSPSIGTNSNVGMSPTMGKNSGLRPKVGMSPYVTRSPTIGKNSPNCLPALTAEVITNGLPTVVIEEALVEGSGQPTEGFPEEPLAKGVSIGAGSLHPTSAGSEISTTNTVATKDIGIPCL